MQQNVVEIIAWIDVSFFFLKIFNKFNKFSYKQHRRVCNKQNTLNIVLE